jgi:hypothetical protein
VKTNFYLQLEFYENFLRGQTKRKPRSPEQEKPKLARSTSLPTIDALHAFKIETNIENESELEGEHAKHAGNAAHRISPHLRLEVSRPPSRTDSMPLPTIQRSPSPPTVQTSRNLRRASRSLYSDLRVTLPKSDSQTALNTIDEDAGGEKEGAKDEDIVVVVKEKEQEPEEVGEGVPNTLIRQASDFEDLSEIHQLMRVHSLPDMAQSKLVKRKLSRGKSFLKNSKINLLDVEEPEHV